MGSVSWTRGRGARGLDRAASKPVRAALLVTAMALLSTAMPRRATADPRTDYMLNCRGCHGPDGAGAPGAAPSFRGQVGRFLSVPGGREYLVQVPGTSQSELDDAHTAALLNWLVHEFSREQVPGDFQPYDAAEVARLRRAPLIDVWGTRRELLQAIDAAAPAHRDQN